MIQKSSYAVARRELLHFLAPSVCLRRASTAAVRPSTSKKQSQSTTPTENELAWSTLMPPEMLANDRPKQTRPVRETRTRPRIPHHPIPPEDKGEHSAPIRALRQSLRQRDNESVVEFWKALETGGWLTHLIPGDLYDLGQVVETYLARAPLGALRVGAENIAIWLATQNEHWALNSALRHHLRSERPHHVIQLFARLRRHPAFTGIIPPDESDDPQELRPPKPTVRSNQEKKERFAEAQVDERFLTFLYPIIAHTMLNDYPGALAIFLENEFDLQPAVLNQFLKRTALIRQKPLVDRLNLYTERAEFTKRITIWSNLLSRLVPLARAKQVDTIKDTVAQVSLAIDQGWLALYFENGKEETHDPQRVRLRDDGIPYITSVHWRGFGWALLECHALGAARELWVWLTQRGVRPTKEMWSAYLDGCCKAGFFSEVSWALEEMKQAQIEPDIISLSTMMVSLFMADDVEAGRSLFVNIKRLAGPADTWGQTAFVPKKELVLRAYNNAIRMLLKKREIQEAEEILAEMNAHGPAPDIVTYNEFIRRHGRAKDLESLGSTIRFILESDTLKPDVYTFTILLHAMKHIDKADVGRMVLDTMQDFGLDPNTGMLTSMIDVILTSQADQDHRSNIYNISLRPQLAPSDQIQTVDAHSTDEDPYDEALLILDYMEDQKARHLSPNEITYTTFLTYLGNAFRGGHLDESTVMTRMDRILSGMRNSDVEPNRVTMHVMMSIYLQCQHDGALQKALDMYRQIEAKGYHPRNDTWYMLLRGLFRLGEVGIAKAIVQDMMDAGHVPRGALARLVENVMSTHS